MKKRYFFVAAFCVLFGAGIFGIVDRVTAGIEDIPDVTVTGTVYHSDGETTIGNIQLAFVAAPDNLLFTDRIFMDGVYNEENVFYANGDFDYSLVVSENFLTGQNNGYVDYPANYDPAYHMYLSVEYDNTRLWDGIDDTYMQYARPPRIDLGVIAEPTTVDVGDIVFQKPNVIGTIATAPGQPTSSARIALTAVGEEPTWDDQMIAIDGSGYDGQFWFYREPGEYILRVYTGGDPVLGYPSHTTLDELQREIAITIGQSGLDFGAVYTSTDYESYETFLPIDDEEPVVSPSVSTLLSGINRTVPSTDTIGLNTHLALQGTSYDNPYLEKMDQSDTRWVREHFATDTDIVGSNNWNDRYTTVIENYRRRNINVVGMLAYNFDADNRFIQPDLGQWSEYVSAVVSQYKEYVKVWEVWNEPDLDKYLNPNTVSNYVPILRTAYQAIKAADPDALVLGGVTARPNAAFLEGLYQQASAYFDEPAIHVYYCDRYRSDGNLSALQRDFASTLAVVNQYRSSDNFWITELGCSTYSDYSEDFQNQYLQAATSYLLSTNRVEKILIYTMLDRDIDDPYEDNFGLLHTDLSPKQSWNWYLSLSGSSSSGSTSSIPVASGTSFFAYDSRIRGGYQITSGNVLGTAAAEIVTGTGDGMGPHVQVFDANGNRKAQFFAYDQSLRNGVAVSACDVNGDGYDEIVTAQGPGDLPLVKIFSGYGEVLNDGFYVLDGKYTGGVHLSCGDTDGDSTQEIVVAARRGGGPHVLVYNQNGKVLTNFMAYDPNFRGGINVTTIDMDGDGRDEIVTGPQFGAPHVQIFQIRPNELKRLSPGFYAFNTDYRGGVQVSGLDMDGDGTKELLVGVGDDATPLVRRYNIREQLQQEFFAFGTNYLGGVMVSGGDVDADGEDEILVMPRSIGGPQVRIIEPGDL